MVKHIVMWKMRKQVGSVHNIADALEIKKRLENLPSIIVEIRKFEIGMNFSLSEKAFDIALYAEFDSKNDLEHYMQHPEHMKVRKFIDIITAEVAVVDFEV